MILLNPRERKKAVNKKELFKEAQRGNPYILKSLLKEWHLKVYTNEELKILNHYLDNHNSNRERHYIEEDLVIELPDLHGNRYPGILNWLQDLGDGYFKAGLTLKDNSTTEWAVKRDDYYGFKALFCISNQPDRRKRKWRVPTSQKRCSGAIQEDHEAETSVPEQSPEKYNSARSANESS